MGSGLWDLVSGIWSVGSGLWDLVSGIWSVGSGRPAGGAHEHHCRLIRVAAAGSLLGGERRDERIRPRDARRGGGGHRPQTLDDHRVEVDPAEEHVDAPWKALPRAVDVRSPGLNVRNGDLGLEILGEDRELHLPFLVMIGEDPQ